MAWRRIGDKPLSVTMLTKFTDEYMRHLWEMSYIYTFTYNFLKSDPNLKKRARHKHDRTTNTIRGIKLYLWTHFMLGKARKLIKTNVLLNNLYTWSAYCGLMTPYGDIDLGP